MGSSRAPESDPNIGIAALKSADVGQQMLDYMRGQAKTTNRWAAEDRSRYQQVFQPLQDSYIAEAKAWDNPARQEAAATKAAADVALASRQGREQQKRQLTALGVNPASGAFGAAARKEATTTALATAGARNLARTQVRQEADQKEANAINMGAGLAVNPGTAMSLSNGAASTGFQGAMQGYQQQGNLLQQDYNNRMQAWQANQGGLNGLLGAVGTVVGAMPWASSEEIKHDKQPFDSLGAVRKMPVEQWTYDAGAGDGGTHVGPYAEDFHAATGVGDGKSIDPITAVGITMGAVRQLDQKVEQIALAVGVSGARGAVRPKPKAEQRRMAA